MSDHKHKHKKDKSNCKKNECEKFVSDCKTCSDRKPDCVPECQFTIQLDDLTPDYVDYSIQSFTVNPFIGRNTFSGMHQYQHFRGNISDAQFFAERAEAEAWLLSRYGVTIIAYQTNTFYGSSSIFSLLYPYSFTVTYTTNESADTLFDPTEEGALPPVILYTPFVSMENYCVSNSDCPCNGARVALLEHRYVILPQRVDSGIIGFVEIPIISYGFMQLYNKNFDLNNKHHTEYVYRYLFPLRMNASYTEGVTSVETADQSEESQTISTTLTTYQWLGSTTAEIAKNDRDVPLRFDGIFTFVVNNTYYWRYTLYNPNPPAQPAVGEIDFVKEVNYIRNKLTANVVFSKCDRKLDRDMAQMGLFADEPINVWDNGVSDIQIP